MHTRRCAHPDALRQSGAGAAQTDDWRVRRAIWGTKAWQGRRGGGGRDREGRRGALRPRRCTHFQTKSLHSKQKIRDIVRIGNLRLRQQQRRTFQQDSLCRPRCPPDLCSSLLGREHTTPHRSHPLCTPCCKHTLLHWRFLREKPSSLGTSHTNLR